MLKEFAVEPAALASWSDCRVVIDRFVMGTGALISEYPKRWRRLVYEHATRQCREVELKRIVERLDQLDRRLLIPSRRAFPDTDQEWILKALGAHTENAFGGIICAKDENSAPERGVISASDVRATHPMFAGLGQAHVRRNSSEMAEAVRLLLLDATHIKFVDQYYTPGAGKEFDGPMREILNMVGESSGRSIQVELHTQNVSPANRPSEDFLEEGFRKLVGEVIPAAEVAVVFYGQGVLHNRFLLTDRGGVMWGTGLDEQGESDRRTDADDLFLLNEGMYQLHWAKWNSSEE